MSGCVAENALAYALQSTYIISTLPKHLIYFWLVMLLTINYNTMMTLENFKKECNVDSFDLIESRNNKKYILTPKGECIMLAKDCDISKEMFVIQHTDADTGETWRFISNTTPGKKIGKI